MERGACGTLWLWAVAMAMIVTLSDSKMYCAKIRQPSRLRGAPSGPFWLLHGQGGVGGEGGLKCCDLSKIAKGKTVISPGFLSPIRSES